MDVDGPGRGGDGLLEKATPSPSVITARSLVFGAFFATVNSSANMYFNFRYSGGLSQYWVIVVSYTIFNRLSSTPRAQYPYCLQWLAPKTGFTPQEHCIVTLCGTAAAFCQSLGLSGGLAPLSLYYGHTFDLSLILLWTFIAGFFGIFVGLTFGQKLVIDSKYPWPVSRMNAETIASFHGRLAATNSTRSNTEDEDDQEDDQEDDEGGMENSSAFHRNKIEQATQQNKAIRIFILCFVVVLPWYVIANVWLKFLVTFPILCWASSTRIAQVLGEGYTGVGFPGFSLGPSIILGWNASIIALETTIWLVVGSILNFWILSPALYYSGNIAPTGESDGLAVWPGGLNIYTTTGAPYTNVNQLCGELSNYSSCTNSSFHRQNCSWGYIPTGPVVVRNVTRYGYGTSYGSSGSSSGSGTENGGGIEEELCYGGRIMLSSTMWLTMIGISWTLIGSIVDAGIDIYCPTVGCHYEDDDSSSSDDEGEEEEEEEEEVDENGFRNAMNRGSYSGGMDVGGGGSASGTLLSSQRSKRRSSSYDESAAVSTLRRRSVGRRMTKSNAKRNRTRGESIVVLQGVPHTASGQRSLLNDDRYSRSSGSILYDNNDDDDGGGDGDGLGTTYGTATNKNKQQRRTSHRNETLASKLQHNEAFWFTPVGRVGEDGNIPGWLGPLGVVVLGTSFVFFVHLTNMGMPIWGTVLTVVFATLMSYGLGALMATTAQNMAMPSAMVLQLLFGFLLPYVGEPNVVAAALTNAIVAQSLTLLNDFKMAVLLNVSTKDMMIAQTWGTLVGVIWSALVYNLILTWNATGIIQLGQGMWANLGAEGSHLLAQLFGEYGLSRIFNDHPTFKWFSLICFITGIGAPFLRRAIPPKYRRFVPNTVLIGLAQFPPANAFSIFSGLLFALFYQVYLKYRHEDFYNKYRFISTSGFNSGVGIGGLILLLMQAFNFGTSVDLGGPVGDGCMVPAAMPQY